MYNELIKKLKRQGIEFTNGLNQDELDNVNKIYNFSFPKQLEKMYRIALPVSKGFYNWRDVTESNIYHIKEVMEIPKSGIYEMADEVYWCDKWGDEASEDERIEFIRNSLKKAPILVPIYAYRYLPVYDVEQSPVFSIHGTDIICYGENLISYFEIEFGYRKQSSIEYSKVTYIPFWSDLL